MTACRLHMTCMEVLLCLFLFIFFLFFYSLVKLKHLTFFNLFIHFISFWSQYLPVLLKLFLTEKKKKLLKFKQ